GVVAEAPAVAAGLGSEWPGDLEAVVGAVSRAGDAGRRRHFSADGEREPTEDPEAFAIVEIGECRNVGRAAGEHRPRVRQVENIGRSGGPQVDMEEAETDRGAVGQRGADRYGIDVFGRLRARSRQEIAGIRASEDGNDRRKVARAYRGKVVVRPEGVLRAQMQADPAELRVEGEVALISPFAVELACGSGSRSRSQAADARSCSEPAVCKAHAAFDVALGGQPIMNSGA